MNARWLLVLIVFLHGPTWAAPFVVTVVDEQTKRGVPLVELRTVSEVRYYTDSNGIVAIDDPALMGQKVFFHIRSHGYEYPAAGFGCRGKALDIRPGGGAVLSIKRVNIAERFYRITGEGIYRDSVIAGRPVPIARPVLNAQVLGQDSVQCAVYRGRISWFWGDTNRLGYALGHFGTAGAVSRLPADGGLDPDKGVDLEYFADDKGFSRPMVDLPAPGMKWIDGLMVLKDSGGGEKLLTHCARMKSLNECIERAMLLYDDRTHTFKPLSPIPVDAPLRPAGHSFQRPDNGTEYIYFADPYPFVRVKADLESVRNLAAYEAFTCLTTGARYEKAKPKLDRAADGRLVWGWKKDTALVTEQQQQQLLKAGRIKPEEAWYQLKDAATNKPVTLHRGSVAYNAFRKRWILIATQHHGESSLLGEIWYAEADRPEGPWRAARKIVTHDRYSFYNPKHHPFFDQAGGRIIYFEGTYTGTFSRKEDFTPRYEYNQIMYRLDLADPRLAIP